MLPFKLLLHRSVEEGAISMPGLLKFIFDAYLIMPSVMQGGVKFSFLSLFYRSGIKLRRLEPLVRTLPTRLMGWYILDIYDL